MTDNERTTFHVKSLQTKTNCRDTDAKMDGKGTLKIQICQSGRCCISPILDIEEIDDFEKCHINEFDKYVIGDCNEFEISSKIKITAKLIHYGTDGWLGDFINILTKEGKYFKCPITGWVDNNDILDLECE